MPLIEQYTGKCTSEKVVRMLYLYCNTKGKTFCKYFIQEEMMKMKTFFAAAFAALMAVGAASAQTKSKSLVLYFSLAGEQYAVGNIKEGNTAIIAKMIAEQTGADIFELETAAAYPINDHNALLDTAKAELNRKARPALKADVPNFDSYDTIYIGYPIWWGDLPMCIYTFMESHQWNGKTVIPFCTHEGSSLAGTESRICSTCKGATLLKGLAVRGSTAQNNRTAARKSVQDWLKQIGK